MYATHPVVSLTERDWASKQNRSAYVTDRDNGYLRAQIAYEVRDCNRSVFVYMSRS